MSVDYLNPPYKILVQPLEWQKQGLQQTNSGYGSKLCTEYMLQIPGTQRMRRVYAVCYSNSASFYIILNGVVTWLRDGDLQEARDVSSL